MTSNDKKMKNKKRLLIGLAALLLAGAGAAVIYSAAVQNQRGELMLSKYPRAFLENTLIVVAQSASPAEEEAAEAVVAELEKAKGSIAEIKHDADVTAADKEKYNLILIGIKDSNQVLSKVWAKSKAEAVTESNPGAGKGVIEIIPNPWNQEKDILIIAGSDERGMRAGEEVLKYVKKLDRKSVAVVNSEHLEESRRAFALGLTLDEFCIFDQEVRAYFANHFPGADFTIGYNRVKQMEYKQDLIVVKATAKVIWPSPSATFGFRKGKVFLISEITWTAAIFPSSISTGSTSTTAGASPILSWTRKAGRRSCERCSESRLLFAARKE